MFYVIVVNIKHRCDILQRKWCILMCCSWTKHTKGMYVLQTESYSGIIFTRSFADAGFNVTCHKYIISHLKAL